MTKSKKAGHPEGQPARVATIAALAMAVGCSAPFRAPVDDAGEASDSGLDATDASDAGADVDIVVPPT